jgi:hypothetical protein
MTSKKIFYSTLTECRAALKQLKIKSVRDYQIRYKEDSRLPSAPHQFYEAEWQGWPLFLDDRKCKTYNTYADAREAVIRLKITTKKEYQSRYKEDPCLQRNPKHFYPAEWHGWSHFLDRPNNSIYGTLTDALEAVKRLNIKSVVEYKVRYKEDPRLRLTPNSYYKNEWQSWTHFLDGRNLRFYITLEEAREATLRLGIKFMEEYKARYKEDPRLLSDPDRFYKAEWKDWPYFLQRQKRPIYKTLSEVCESVLRLNIKSMKEYKTRYKEDPLLRSDPNLVYKNEWQDWYHLLGRNKRLIYSTLAEAREAVSRLNIKSIKEYKARCKEDPRLPYNARQIYEAEWTNWYDFLNSHKRPIYNTLAEACEAVQRLKIKSIKEYILRFKEDPLLRSAPNYVYKAEWRDWNHYLGNHKRPIYATLSEAREAVKQLNIKSSDEYKARYKENPNLPSTPQLVYKEEWQGWTHFLSNFKPSIYNNLTEARDAVLRLGIKSSIEYATRYKEDPHLPSRPDCVYKDEWQTTKFFFLSSQKNNFYQSFLEASQAIQKLKILSYTEYAKKYKADPRLHSTPDLYYASEWKSWTDTCLPKIISTLNVLKQACKVLQIRDSQQYREIRKEYKMLPAHPERFDGWIDWFDLLDIPVPYSYQELVGHVRKAGCQNLSDYKKWRTESNDPKIPFSPMEVYEKSGWTNYYDFFGKLRPYQTKYLDSDWEAWSICITEFLKQARGGTTKQQELCQFVRDYIQAEGLDSSPYDFLTRTKVNVKPLLDLLNQLPVHKKKRQLYSINEFLDWIIKTELTIEGEHTGEILRIKNAANPFKHINFDNEQYVPTINETNKPSLPYQFVKTGRDWIFPVDSVLTSTSYNDLTHLHKFTADWIPISDPTILDHSDSDCVTKTERDKVYLWNPIFWTYTYALMQLPARGKQIVYCDSGEMDEEIPDFKDGNLLWLKNSSKKAGLTKRQGMIYKTENGDFGVHYTSNKTQLFGEGFDIPYMPMELAYWLIKLRKWQQKYNTVDIPTPWLKCKRTKLNEIQRNYKGANCFLFRDIYDTEPGTFHGRLADRLAAALFFAVKDEAIFATYRDCTFKEISKKLEEEPSLNISRFSSNFTPHSMRVSLINAYAFEFGLPLEVIVKLVGHASIVMTLYYVKSGLVRQKVELGEKQAFKNAREKAQRFLDEHGIEEFRTQLTANNPEFLNSLSNKHPSSTYLWKDFGICPVGGNSCSSGGDIVVVGANLYNPVPAGYIGEQNCPRCRFFITGPAFLIGQVAIYNEITLALTSQSLRHSELQQELTDVCNRIEIISHQQYEQLKTGKVTSKSADDKEVLRAKRRKLNSEIETRAKKMDMLFTDLNFLYRHIQNSRVITKNLKPTESNKLMLVVPDELDFDISLEESTHFRLLSEVCENAELFHSCSNELALAKRSQNLDKLMMHNGIKPKLLLLDEREQTIIGNQLTQLMYSRIQSWETIDRLIDGDLTLRDLDSDVHLTANDIKKVLSRAKPIRIGEIK